jgi:hypothetical protein
MPIPQRSGYAPTLKPSVSQQSFEQQRAPQQQYRPPYTQQQRAPSVSFSELDVFANPEKLRPEDEFEEDDEFGYYEEEDDDITEEGALHMAANLAAEVQQDQNYGFVPTQQPSVAPLPERHEQRLNQPTGPTPYGYQQQQQQQQYDANDETEAQTHERVRLIAKLKRHNSHRKDDDKIIFDEDAPIKTLRRLSIGKSYETKAKIAVTVLRRGTLFLSKFIEKVAAKYPGYIGNLEGWSENVYLSLDQYDEMLYDIYDEYGDIIKTNPVITFVFALGTNAAMYAMAKGIADNPMTGVVMKNLAEMLNKANNNVKSTQPPTPGTTEGPAVPVNVASADGVNEASANSNPMAGLASMFGGADMQNILGGLDINQLLSGMGDLMGNTKRTGDVPGDYRGEPMPNASTAHVTEIKVNDMQAAPDESSQSIMNLMRQKQDELETINENGTASHTFQDETPQQRQAPPNYQKPVPRQQQYSVSRQQQHEQPNPRQDNQHSQQNIQRTSANQRFVPDVQHKQRVATTRPTPSTTRTGSRLSFNN